MEETVRNMMEYKTKIDQLKQEKSNLALTYEVSYNLRSTQYICHLKGLGLLSPTFTCLLIVFLSLLLL